MSLLQKCSTIILWMICFYDNYSAANPMNLAISEISFGNDAFAEMKSNITTFTHVEPNYFLLLANRNVNRRWNNIVMAVISLANMELENGKFVVVRTKPTEDPSLVSNLINVTSTTFLPTINPDNLLDLEDEDAMIVLLLYGELDIDLFHLTGRKIHLPLDKHLLKEIEKLIVDSLIFGGKKSPSGPKSLMKQYLK